MMNPFTRFLSQWSSDGSLTEFASRWDEVEALAIRVYKAKTTTAEQQELYADLRPWLLDAYPQWEAQLRPYWEQSKVGGTLEHDDPFRYVLRPETAEGFIDNWTALQYLPAAREALNGLLRDR